MPTITHDSVLLAAASESIFDSAIHLPCASPPPWLKFLRIMTSNPRLDLIHFPSISRHALVAWVYTPSEGFPASFMELESFSSDPSSIWPDDLMSPTPLLARLQPLETQLAERQARRTAAAEFAMAAAEADMEESRRVASALRRSGAPEADILRAERGGRVVALSPEERQEAIAAAKNRISVSLARPSRKES